MYFLSWVVLGAASGWITGQFIQGNQLGPWMDMVIGIAGALAGGFLIRYGGFPGRSEMISTTLSAILGAVVLTALAAFLNGRKRIAE
jgi:uncharacterized membrane protein YeaQ/YmgE (transglycosylase-associated protein family)